MGLYYNLAKVGVESSNLFARSNKFNDLDESEKSDWPRIGHDMSGRSLGGIKSSFRKANIEFPNTLISVFGILIGFGVSVLFFIADQNKTIPEDVSSEAKREEKLRFQRVVKMRNFVFYRMSYFVFCSISIIVFAILIVTFSFVSLSQVANTFPDALFAFLRTANSAATLLIYFALYFLIFESLRGLYSFMGSLIYYFNYRLKHNI